MTRENILDKSETLDHNQRWEYMIRLGKKSLTDKSVATSLIELANSTVHYERVLAIMSTQGSFNKALIAKLVEDPSMIGLGVILSLAAKYLENQELIDIIPRLSKKRRTRITAALLALGRTDIIEQLYTKSDPATQNELLLYTSEVFFKAHITEGQLDCFTEKQWRHFTKRFPVFAHQQIESIITKTAEPSWLVRQAVDVILHQLHKTAPSIGLTLLRNSFTLIYPQGGVVTKYFVLYPHIVADILLGSPSNHSFSFPAITLRKLRIDVLSAMVKRNMVGNLSYAFPKLFADQRTQLYEGMGAALRSENGSIPLSYVAAFDQPTRAKEALHAFNLPILATSPIERLPYLSMLSFAEALPLATPFLAQPEGELRAKALSALVGCGRYNSAELDGILDFCVKRENEQDPVRLEMIRALADLPPTHWSAIHLPKFNLIIAAVLSARDCSNQTMEVAARLLLRMLSKHSDFVVAELPKIVARMGSLHARATESVTNEEFIKLDTCLHPLLKTWIARDNAYSAVSLISMFGSRIKSVYKAGTRLNFVQLLIDMTYDQREYVARLGLDTLSRLGINGEVFTLIPKLLELDGGWIQVNTVSQYLHRYRQNLLTPYLKPQVYSKRFSSGGTAILPGFDGGFVRWTANQQRIYAQSVNCILRGANRSAWELYSCVKRLGVMPSADLDALISLAQLNAKDIALRDKALEALGRADAGRGVATLIEALDDNRARIAIYALRRSIMSMPTKSAHALLAQAPKNKITVQKEIIRLVGELGGDQSYRFLISQAKEQHLHPDVQIALLRAFWKHLNTGEVWTYFHKAAQSNSAAIARATIRIPQEGLTTPARHKLGEHMVLLLKNENAQVRRESLERLVSMPIGLAQDFMLESMADLLEDIDPHTSVLAAQAMLSEFIHKQGNKLVETFAKVTDTKSLAAVVDAFQSVNYINVETLRACAESVSYAVIKANRNPSQALRLAVALLHPTKILSIINELDTQSLLHPGVVGMNQDNWDQAVRNYSQNDVEKLEEKLRESENEKLRRLGLGLLLEMSNQHGWTMDRIKWIQAYCSDASLWVAEVAGMVQIPHTLDCQS